jgi:Ca2+-binding RTX toxin-like protein
MPNALAAREEVMAIRGTSGDDTINGADDVKNTIFGLEGNDSLTGGSDNDTLYGGAGDDSLWGADGRDQLFGGAGDDLIEEGSPGDGDRLHGGNGSDTLRLFYGTFFGGGVGAFEFSFSAGYRMTTPGGSVADGFEKLDITGSDFNDTITGGRFDDFLRGWEGDDLLDGGRGDDRIFGDNGGDTMMGGKGDDSLSGGGSDDVLIGGDGDDTLIGGRSFDVFSGDDTLIGGRGADSFYGGLGSTTVSYATSRAGVYVDVPGNDCHGGDAEGDRFFDGAGGYILGSRFADTLMGAGNMDGGRGADRLIAEWGSWSMTGGAGDDVFAFTWNGEFLFNHPQVTDFRQGHDTLDLSLIDARTFASGDQAFTFIGTDAFDGKPGEVRYEVDEANGLTIIQMSMDRDGNAQHSITLQGVYTLTGEDFVL